jgi:hypothetical protein
VEIGHDVWIGDGAFISRGVKIGTGAVIAARAVVTKDVAPYSIVAGIPARHIRYRFPKEVCQRLLSSAWFLKDLTGLKLDYGDVPQCLDQIEAADPPPLSLPRSVIRPEPDGAGFRLENAPAE